MEKTLEQIQAELEALKTQFNDFSALSPVSYYTHQYSGEEIDDSVGVTQNTVPTLVRPNLLDNWYFGHPVNQRGETSKSGINNGYWLDRWYLSGYNQTVEITQSGLRWTSTTGIWFTQRIDDAIVEALIGKTVTISAIVNGELKTKTQKLDKNTAIICLLNDGIQRLELSSESKLFRFVSYTSPTVPLTILAAKLELGPTQTLAHKEGDRWVLNEVPDYGEQLRRCQRYAIELIPQGVTYSVLGNGVYLSSDGCVFVFVPVPVSPRTHPVVSANGDFRLVDRSNAGSGIPVNISRMRVDHYSTNGVSLACYVADQSQLVEGQCYELWLVNSAGSLILSADL